MPASSSSASTLRVRAVVLTALLILPSAAIAQIPGAPGQATAPAPTAAPEPETEAADSPRVSVRAFTQFAGRNDYASAARYLSLSPDHAGRGPELARRLRAVLERRTRIDLDDLSPASEGTPNDGLPPGVDRIATIADGTGGEDPVFVTRLRDQHGSRWVFSRQTVVRIDGWYDALGDRWIRESLPEPLLRAGPKSLMWWQWLALPVIAVLAYAMGSLLCRVTASVLGRWFRRTSNTWDERLLARLTPSISLIWSVVAALFLLPWLALLPGSMRFVAQVLASTLVFAVFYGLWRSVDVFVDAALERPSNVGNASVRSLVSVGGNLLKIVLVVGGVAILLEVFGFQVATVLAGLGIGGIAIAFGAQKTVENLFGSVALAADQPFRVGDFIRFEDVSGTVETIGTRSTRIRTLDCTLVTVPNGKLSDTRIESFGTRDRIRLAITVSLVYGTTRAQMTQVVSGIEQLLRSHPAVWQDTIVAKLAALGPSSLDIEVLCWFQTSDIDAFRAYRQEVLLGIMKVVEAAGTGFAFPTRTVHLVRDTPAPGGSSRA